MLAMFDNLRDIIRHWWMEFTLQTKLMGAATLVVSLIVSGLTFWAVNTIQADARINDTRFGRDLGLLLAANIAPQLAENDLTTVARFSNRFYHSTSSLRYILYADDAGNIRLGIPFSESEVQNSLMIERRIHLPEKTGNKDNKDLPLVRQHQTPEGIVTDVFVPIEHEGKFLGTLAIGINPNPTVVASTGLTRDVTIAVFVSIWVMVILGAVFNALQITKPIKELLSGVKNIAAGNFKQRIDLPFGGELGELIANFNEMAEKLEIFEEQNIDELTAEKAKLETLVTTIADGAVLIDNNLNIVLVNPNARRFFGWDHLDLNGTNVLHVLPGSVSAELTRPLYQVAAGKLDGEEFRITLNHPAQRTVRILITNVLDPVKENVRAIAMTVQDITREVELNEAKSQFISNVSHELRTPLFNIKSFIETLHEYGDELTKDERSEFLDTANRETDRLTRLVNDVLDLSKLESSHTYLFDAVELDRSIEQTLRTYQLNARDKGVELCQDIEAELPSILGNYDLILQVLANLVGNALKFTKANGKVTIRAYRAQLTPEVGEEINGITSEVVRVEVVDTGIGIDPEDQRAIFDRFFRVENRVHTLEGTGLGLSIVQNIIEKHHTQIHITSAVGVGTTFWFDLAIYEKQQIQHLEDMQLVESGGWVIGDNR
jgi:two-component system, OmpR family, sensor histidine kinase NblS